MLISLLEDLRWTARLARRRPGFTSVVIATLAVAIAAATIAFGLADAVLWRPLPFADASRLVFVWEDVERDGVPQAARVTAARYEAWRDAAAPFASIAAFGSTGFTAGGPDGASTLYGVRVSAAYFETLGLPPILGRGLGAADHEPGQHRVIVLSHGLWQQRFGARRDVIGEPLRLNGEPYTIVGVMPPAVFPAWPVNPAIVSIDPELQQFWVPMPRTPAAERNARAHVLGVVARLRPGVTAGQAAAELDRLRDPSAPDPHGARVTPLRDQFVRDSRALLLALVGASLAVLLIACANLAALQVSMVERRRTELAVRSALGAGFARLARQLIIESTVLASAGGVAGAVLAWVALPLLPRILPASIPLLTRPGDGTPTVAFASIVSLGAGVLLALWPIARVRGAALATRGVSLAATSAVYRGLVVSQIAVTMALVVGAALLGQSLRHIRGQDPGFDIDRVLVTDVTLPHALYGTAESVASAEARMMAALARAPGVTAAATAYDHPLEANWTDAFHLIGSTPREGSLDGSAELRIVSPGYFAAMGVDVLDGREFADRDRFGAPGVALVNASFARMEGAGRVRGKRLLTAAPRMTWGGAAASDYEIVGVAADERFRGLDRPAMPAVYLSTRQFPQQGFVVLTRSAGDPSAIAGAVRSTLRAVDREMPIGASRSLASILGEQLAARRVTTDVLGGFATTALALAALGLYGLLALFVSGRAREIGLRLALGASPAAVTRQVVRQTVVNGGLGIAAGSILSLWTGRLLGSLLAGVTLGDLPTLVGAIAAMLAVAGTASVVPAWRAARTDPAVVLRSE